MSHIRDEEYTFKYNDKRPVDFNPLLNIKSKVNLEVPQDIKDDLINQLNGVKNNYYKNKLVEKLKDEGIDVTNNRKYISDAERQCVNSVIQGSAADMSKRAMIMLGTNKELKELGFKMLFPVHDIL